MTTFGSELTTVRTLRHAEGKVGTFPRFATSNEEVPDDEEVRVAMLMLEFFDADSYHLVIPVGYLCAACYEVI